MNNESQDIVLLKGIYSRLGWILAILALPFVVAVFMFLGVIANI